MIFSIFTSLLYIVTFFCYLCLIYLSFTGVSMLFTIVSYLRYWYDCFKLSQEFLTYNTFGASENEKNSLLMLFMLLLIL